MMETVYNIFSVKATEFDEGQRDPFGFDNFSEKLSSKYLPFVGAVRKPIYFFFIAYVNWLWENGKLNSKKKEETRLRLEKLLFLSWKYNSENLTGKNVLGNRQKKINPFRGNDGNWIIQTCFKIYGASVNKVITDSEFIEKYVLDNPDEVKILNEFLSKEGLLDSRNEAFLRIILQKLAKKKKNHSLFSGNHQLTTKYKNLFKRYLKTSIRNTNEDYYYDIRSFFNYTNKLEERIYKRTIENEKKYHFKAFNNWFAAFILAVDKNINEEDSKNDWIKADLLYKKIRWQEMPAGIRQISDRPISDKRTWFDRQGKKYIKIEEGKNKFNQEGWDAILRRAQNENFYDFKHFALTALLQDIY